MSNSSVEAVDVTLESSFLGEIQEIDNRDPDGSFDYLRGQFSHGDPEGLGRVFKDAAECVIPYVDNDDVSQTEEAQRQINSIRNRTVRALNTIVQNLKEGYGIAALVSFMEAIGTINAGDTLDQDEINTLQDIGYGALGGAIIWEGVQVNIDMADFRDVDFAGVKIKRLTRSVVTGIEGALLDGTIQGNTFLASGNGIHNCDLRYGRSTIMDNDLGGKDIAGITGNNANHRLIITTNQGVGTIHGCQGLQTIRDNEVRGSIFRNQGGLVSPEVLASIEGNKVVGGNISGNHGINRIARNTIAEGDILDNKAPNGRGSIIDSNTLHKPELGIVGNAGYSIGGNNLMPSRTAHYPVLKNNHLTAWLRSL